MAIAQRASATWSLGFLPSFVPGFQTVWLSWLNARWGIWLMIGSFILASAGQARTNGMILGTIVLIPGLWSAAVSEQDQPVLIR